MKKNRYLPYGYSIRNGIIVVNEMEAEVIRRIFDDYICGTSMQALADKMTTSGTPYTEKRTQWNKNIIARILQNKRYAGDGDFDPIISERTFNIANDEKKARTRYERPVESGLLNIVLKKVYCPKCGDQMFIRHERKHSASTVAKCKNPSCQYSVAISESELLQEIQTKLNLIIDNIDILSDSVPYKEHEDYNLAAVTEGLERLCNTGYYDDQYLIQVIMGNASDLYNHFSNSRLLTVVNVNAAFANAIPTDTFNAELFLLTVKHVTLRQNGNLTLTLKSDIEI